MGEALEMPPKLAIVKTAMVEANPYFFVRVQIWSPLNAGEMPEIKRNPGGVKSKRGNPDNFDRVEGVHGVPEISGRGPTSPILGRLQGASNLTQGSLKQ